MNRVVKINSEILWDYHKLNPDHELPESADAIIALGCKDTGVAERAAAVFKTVETDLLLFSGEYGKYTQGYFTQTEAETFAEVARFRGVPDENIVLETQARNTGENVRFSQELLEQMGHTALRSVILVQRPFMERRIKATFDAQWRGAEHVAVTTTSEDIGFERYVDYKGFEPDYVTSLLVDTTERVMRYPALGYQTPQEIPDDVLEAYDYLCGYLSNHRYDANFSKAS